MDKTNNSTENLSDNLTKFYLAKLSEIETSERYHKFKNVGLDIRLYWTIEKIITKNVKPLTNFEKIFSLNYNDNSIDSYYIRPIINQIAGLVNEFCDVSKIENLQGKKFLLGIESNYSVNTKQSYENVVVCLPLIDEIDKSFSL